MILIIRETLIYLRPRNIREAPCDEAVHSLTVLKKSDDIVNANPRALDNSLAATHARFAREVTVADGWSILFHRFQNTSGHAYYREF